MVEVSLHLPMQMQNWVYQCQRQASIAAEVG